MAPETSKRIHRAVSADGTPIAGRVRGQGPPLVLVPGGPADGEIAWGALLPHLTDHFTCYALNTRGRALSGDHPDHSRARLVEDVVAFVESIGDSVALFGHSAGGAHALEAAAHTSAVATLALYEPALTELADEDLLARVAQAFTRVRHAADEGRLADAAWIFLEELALINDTERAIVSEADVAQAMAPLVPVVLKEADQSGPPQLTSLSLLDRVTMPVLLLHGSRTDRFYTQVVDYLADRLVDCQVREIPEVGHLGPEIEPEPVSVELVRLLDATAPEIKDQAAILLGHVAGYTGHRTVGIGLRSGLIRALADAPAGATADDLAARTGHDPFYVEVWCRSALAGGVCERDGDTYRLAPHMATLLLDEDCPAYAGGIFAVFEQPELFDRSERVLGTGERMWWHDTSPEWIDGVSKSGRPFYTRLVPGGLEQVPGLTERLADGGVIVDTGCGAGLGLVRLAEHYPACELVGVDGDAHSIEVARETVEAAGIGDRVRFVTAPLEEFTIERPASLVINNITMHECRDIDRVTKRVRDALEPGGLFVISDFPFPDSDEVLAAVPGRVMAGIQFFEAQIDDQLLPRHTYDALLERHGFTDLGTTSLTPVHALTWGRRA